MSPLQDKKAHAPYIRSFLKKLILEIESDGAVVVDELYEELAFYMASLKVHTCYHFFSSYLCCRRRTIKIKVLRFINICYVLSKRVIISRETQGLLGKSHFFTLLVSVIQQ